MESLANENVPSSGRQRPGFLDRSRFPEVRLQQLIAEVTDYAIILLDTSGIISSWNKGAQIIKGYSADEIIGLSFTTFYSADDRAAGLPERLLKQAADSGSVAHEGWRIRKDGSRFWGSVVITALHDDSGDIVGFSKVTRDLTERKMAEDRQRSYAEELRVKNAELEKSEQRYHRMIAEVQDYAIILLDEHGVIQNWNAGAEKIKGYRADEIIGSRFEIFYPAADKASGLPQELINEARLNGRAAHEGWRMRKDGSRFWGYVVITALHNDQGAVIGFSKVTRDLTEKKKADDLLRENALELESKNHRLERLNEEISSFSYVASHDLKEPLRKIQTFANRILESGSVEDAHGFADRILASASRMRKLIDDLLSYAGLSSNEAPMTDVDLNEVVKAALTDLELKVAEKRAGIRVDSLPVIKGVEFQLQQLFTNLISNALKFSKPDMPAEISISVTRVRGNEVPSWLSQHRSVYYKISVSDKGIGFDQSDATRIFEVFQRLHPAQEISGTGIGLAIVKRIVENHNGAILAQSAPGQGATFDLYFHAFHQ